MQLYAIAQKASKETLSLSEVPRSGAHALYVAWVVNKHLKAYGKKARHEAATGCFTCFQVGWGGATGRLFKNLPPPTTGCLKTFGAEHIFNFVVSNDTCLCDLRLLHMLPSVACGVGTSMHA